MATGTYAPIASITLGSSASSVEFSSIPQDYRDLVLTIDNPDPVTQTEFQLNFNSDSGSNYTAVNMNGNGSTTDSFTATRTYLRSHWSEDKGFAINQIMDYSATDKHKTVLNRSNFSLSGSDFVYARAGRWADTSAITTILVTASADMPADTRISLYGIAS